MIAETHKMWGCAKPGKPKQLWRLAVVAESCCEAEIS